MRGERFHKGPHPDTNLDIVVHGWHLNEIPFNPITLRRQNKFDGQKSGQINFKYHG